MIHVRLRSQAVFPWQSAGSMRIRGLLPGDRAPGNPPLPGGAGRELEATLAAAPGPICLVLEEDDRLVAGVDRLRSFPLFYAVLGPDLFLGDDARWVRSRIGATPPDEVRVLEALLSGFVAGHDTLDPGVSQLGAGEILRAECRGGRVTTSIEIWDRWFSPRSDRRHGTPGGERESVAELDSRLEQVANRLVDGAAGRLVVIPLTGGYDSRLVAMLLKEAGYDRVLCVGSRAPSHWEVVIGREVASRLGFEWVHLGGEPRDWPGWYRSEERVRFAREADGLCHVPPLLEWPALVGLRDRGVDPRDSWIVAGHFGAFVAGSATPGRFEYRRSGDPLRSALEYLLHRRYVLNALPPRRSALRASVEARVLASLRAAAASTPSVEEAVDRWEWREYQTKRAGTVVRLYEHFGFEWVFPLAAPELVHFWRGASNRERAGNDLYHRAVDRRGRAWNLPPANPGSRPRSSRILRVLAHRTGLTAPVRSVLRRIRRRSGRGVSRGDGVGWEALFPASSIRSTYTGLEGVESYLIRDWLAARAPGVLPAVPPGP